MAQSYVDEELLILEETFESTVEEMKDLIELPIADNETVQLKVASMQDDLQKELKALEGEADSQQKTLLQLNSQEEKAEILLQNSVVNASEQIKLAIESLEDFKNELLDSEEIEFSVEKDKLLRNVDDFIEDEEEQNVKEIEACQEEIIALEQEVEQSSNENEQSIQEQNTKLAEYEVKIEELEQENTEQEAQVEQISNKIDIKLDEALEKSIKFTQSSQEDINSVKSLVSQIKTEFSEQSDLVNAIQRDTSENLTEENAELSKIRESEYQQQKDFTNLKSEFLQAKKPTEQLFSELDDFKKIESNENERLEEEQLLLEEENADLLMKIGASLQWQKENEALITNEQNQEEEMENYIQKEMKDELITLLNNPDLFAETQFGELVKKQLSEEDEKLANLDSKIEEASKSFDEELLKINQKCRENELSLIEEKQEINNIEELSNQEICKEFERITQKNNKQLESDIENRLKQHNESVSDAMQLISSFKEQIITIQNEVQQIESESISKENIVSLQNEVNEHIEEINEKVTEFELNINEQNANISEIMKTLQKDEEEFRNSVLDEILATNKEVKMDVIDILRERDNGVYEKNEDSIDSSIIAKTKDAAAIVKDELRALFDEKITILQESIEATQAKLNDNIKQEKEQFTEIDKIMTGFAKDNSAIKQEKLAIEALFEQAQSEIRDEFEKYKEALFILESKIVEGNGSVAPDTGMNLMQQQLDELEHKILPLLAPNNSQSEIFAKYYDEVQKVEELMTDELTRYEEETKAFMFDQRNEIDQEIRESNEKATELFTQLADKNSQIVNSVLPRALQQLVDQMNANVGELQQQQQQQLSGFVSSHENVQRDYSLLQQAVREQVAQPLISAALFEQIYDKISEISDRAKSQDIEIERQQAQSQSVQQRLLQWEARSKAAAEGQQGSAEAAKPRGGRDDLLREQFDALYDGYLQLMDDRIQLRLDQFAVSSELGQRVEGASKQLQVLNQNFQALSEHSSSSVEQINRLMEQAVQFREDSIALLEKSKVDALGILKSAESCDVVDLQVGLKGIQQVIEQENANIAQLSAQQEQFRVAMQTTFLAENVRQPLLSMQQEFVCFTEKIEKELIPSAMIPVRNNLVDDMNKEIQRAFDETHQTINSIETFKAEILEKYQFFTNKNNEKLDELELQIAKCNDFRDTIENTTKANIGDIRNEFEQLQFEFSQEEENFDKNAVALEQINEQTFETYSDLITSFEDNIMKNFSEIQKTFQDNLEEFKDSISLSNDQFEDTIIEKIDSNEEQTLSYETSFKNERDEVNMMLEEFTEILNSEQSSLSEEINELVERIEGASGLKQEEFIQLKDEVDRKIEQYQEKNGRELEILEKQLQNNYAEELQAVTAQLQKYAGSYSQLCDGIQLLKEELQQEMSEEFSLQKQKEGIQSEVLGQIQQSITNIEKRLEICEDESEAAMLVTAKFSETNAQIESKFKNAISESVAALENEKDDFIWHKEQIAAKIAEIEVAKSQLTEEVESVQSQQKQSESLQLSVKPQSALQFVGFDNFDRVDISVKQAVEKLAKEAERRGIALKSCRIVKVKGMTYDVNLERVTVEMSSNSIMATIFSTGKKVSFIEWIYNIVVGI